MGRVHLRIRWKLLMLLLAIALVPLGIVAFVAQRGARRLGTDFAEQTGTILAQTAELHLQTIVDHAASVLFRERQLIESVLAKQALEIDARLAHSPRGSARVYFDSDFDNPASSPEAMQPSPRHFTLTDDGRRQPLLVSFAHQVVRLAPGITRDSTAGDIARLANLTDVYRDLQARHDDLIYWQYTALDSGVHTSFPGKGGYPADYDARTRPWYRVTQERNALNWAPPTRDATTGNVMLTCAMPVHRPDGSATGVTAIDVSLGELLRQVDLPRPWRRHARALFVVADLAASPDAPLVLVDQYDDDSGVRTWRHAMASVPLRGDDPQQTRAIVADMAAGRHNVRQLQQDGQAWSCAYGPIADAGTFFMVMVPRVQIVAAATRIEQQMHARTNGQLQLTGMIAGGVLLLTVAAGLLASRHFTRPLRHLADAADRIAAGDLDTRVRIRTGDELQQLGVAFNGMVPKLRDLLTVRQSLSLAMEVQQSLLPDTAPRIDGLDIAGHSIYCDETGGDYYDFLTVEQVAPRIVAIAVGDVAGHGIAAALLMATARALIRSHIDNPAPLGDTITSVNRHLTSARRPGRFMTLYCCVIDTTTRTVRWTSAGHDPAIVYHPDRDAFSQWAGEDVPLGIDPAWTYHEASLTGWTRGDVMVIGTDGIWECRNLAMEQFGKDRLREVIRANAARSAADISQAITDAVVAYRGGKPQEDDITLVVVKLL